MTVHTIYLTQPKPEPGAMCCQVMELRKKKRLARGSQIANLRNQKGKQRPCPNMATRLIGGKPYCSAHAPEYSERSD